MGGLEFREKRPVYLRMFSGCLTCRPFPAIKSDSIRRLFQKEVCGMDTQALWESFCRTGEPLVYLLYQAAREDQTPGSPAGA